MLELRVSSLAETHAVAAAIAGLARAGDLIVLSGDMGAGKTAFAKGFGAALGVSDPITSPTYTLVHTYELPRTAPASALHHADLYRLDRTAEVADLALVDLAEDGGIVLVEWGDVAEALLGDHVSIHLDVDDEDDDDDGLAVNVDGARLVEISATGPSWAGRWSRMVAALEEFSC